MLSIPIILAVMQQVIENKESLHDMYSFPRIFAVMQVIESKSPYMNRNINI